MLESLQLEDDRRSVNLAMAALLYQENILNPLAVKNSMKTKAILHTNFFNFYYYKGGLKFSVFSQSIYVHLLVINAFIWFGRYTVKVSSFSAGAMSLEYPVNKKLGILRDHCFTL